MTQIRKEQKDYTKGIEAGEESSMDFHKKFPHLHHPASSQTDDYV